MAEMHCRDKRVILIVEDCPDDRLLLADALHAAHVTTPLVFVETVREAEDYLMRQTGWDDYLPCMILLDLSLPMYGGLDFLQDLRSNPATRRIPVIVLTGSQSEDDLLDSYQYGANSYITKSDSLGEFYDKISCLCNYWLNICQLPAC